MPLNLQKLTTKLHTKALYQLGALVSWENLNFHLYEKFPPGMKVSPGILVLSLVQFDFRYSSPIITLNSAFILGL